MRQANVGPTATSSVARFSDNPPAYKSISSTDLKKNILAWTINIKKFFTMHTHKPIAMHLSSVR